MVAPHENDSLVLCYFLCEDLLEKKLIDKEGILNLLEKHNASSDDKNVIISALFENEIDLFHCHGCSFMFFDKIKNYNALICSSCGNDWAKYGFH